MIEPKPLFIERIEKLLPDKKDREAFWEIIKEEPIASIRCNTIKISPGELKKRLEEKGWKIEQPYKDYPEIMIVSSELLPGELGKAKEHLLGYYYVQEISSMLPLLGLKPGEEDILLDLAAAPGSKTTQASAMMKNSGTIIANDVSLGRISILSANLEKVGASDVVITRHDGVQLCKKLGKLGMKFDKILADVPCTGEGNIRSNIKTLLMWNIKAVEKLSRMQKKLAVSALEILKPGGEMLYSTCTHAPEENELVVQYLLDNFNVQIQEFELPLKTREGITKWRGKGLSPDMKKAHRVWPQDNNTEGFFLCKLKKMEEK